MNKFSTDQLNIFERTDIVFEKPNEEQEKFLNDKGLDDPYIFAVRIKDNFEKNNHNTISKKNLPEEDNIVDLDKPTEIDINKTLYEEDRYDGKYRHY